jgi:hypothetical protein
MSPASPTETLTLLRTLAARLTRQPAPHAEAAGFMYRLVDLGVALAGDPGRRESREVSAFIDETAPHLVRGFDSLGLFAMEIRARSQNDWSADPHRWEELCRRRSAVEFLCELYRETALAELLPEIDNAWLDEIMRETGVARGHFSREDVPAGMPPTHWWWWLPAAPSLGAARPG